MRSYDDFLRFLASRSNRDICGSVSDMRDAEYSWAVSEFGGVRMHKL